MNQRDVIRTSERIINNRSNQIDSSAIKSLKNSGVLVVLAGTILYGLGTIAEQIITFKRSFKVKRQR